MSTEYEENSVVLYKDNNYKITGSIEYDDNNSKSIYLSLNNNDEKFNIGSLVYDQDKHIYDSLECNDFAVAIIRDDIRFKQKHKSIIKIFYIPTMSDIYGTEYQLEDMYKVFFGEKLEKNEIQKIKTYYL